MARTFEPIPTRQPTIEDFPHGYAETSRGIVPELKFHYSCLKYIPIIQFVNSGKTFDTVFHKFEYQMREIVGFKWDNNIRKIYYYDGAKIALPFYCYFIGPLKDDRFCINVWNLNGTKIIFNKTITFQTKHPDSNTSHFPEWYNFILPEDIVQEIGNAIKEYNDYLVRYV